MSGNQIPLQQVFQNTVAKMRQKIGLARQLMVDTETWRLYLHDGVTKGGHPIKKIDDPTEEIRTIPFKGPDPVAGETWVMGEWPSDDDPQVNEIAYVAGVYDEYELTNEDITNATSQQGIVSGEQLALLGGDGAAAYELTDEDVTNATSQKGVVSGEQLAALGGAITTKTVLIRDDGVGGSTWQHLITSADLAGGDEFIFILGSSSSADMNVVCIPSEASVPELAELNELKFIIYGGTGKSGFSGKFDGDAKGAQLVGSNGITGAGCVIARKVSADSWFISYEVTKASGPEILKDWTRTTSLDTNLFDGLDVSTLDYNDVHLEFRNIRGYGGGGTNPDNYINLQFRNTGGVEFSVGNKSSNLAIAIASGDDNLGGKDCFPLFSVSFGIFNGSGTVSLLANEPQGVAGFVADCTTLSASKGTGSPVSRLSTVASFHNGVGNGLPSELWLHGPSDTGLTFKADYRIIKREPTGL